MEARKIFTWILFVLLIVSLWKVKSSFATISVFRHVLGIIGTGLIFGADVFYSSRKYGKIGFGKLKWYINAHVVIGIVGPIPIPE